MYSNSYIFAIGLSQAVNGAKCKATFPILPLSVYLLQHDIIPEFLG